MELEKFQFQGTFNKIHFIVPLGKGKSIKIIKVNSHQKHEARTGEEAKLDKKNAVVLGTRKWCLANASVLLTPCLHRN